MITDAQVRKLMSEKAKTGRTGIAALKAGMSRNTAAKYLKEGKLPSEMKGIRDWRTRPDPFQQHWAEIEARLVGEPGLEARSIFEELQELHPGQAGGVEQDTQPSLDRQPQHDGLFHHARQ